MTHRKDQSLGELEALYGREIRTLSDERAALARRLGECDDKLAALQEKLRWVRTLMGAPGAAAVPRPAKAKRRGRKSPVRDAMLRVLRESGGQWLTARQIATAVRKRTHRGVSRQAVNVNLNKLEKAGKVRRQPAPPGSGGAQFVYLAV